MWRALALLKPSFSPGFAIRFAASADSSPRCSRRYRVQFLLCLARLTQHCWLSPRSPIANGPTPLCTYAIGKYR